LPCCQEGSLGLGGRPFPPPVAEFRSPRDPSPWAPATSPTRSRSDSSASVPIASRANARLVVRDEELPGRFVIIDGEFRPAQ
jgi:hypothetical protein